MAIHSTKLPNTADHIYMPDTAKDGFKSRYCIEKNEQGRECGLLHLMRADDGLEGAMLLCVHCYVDALQCGTLEEGDVTIMVERDRCTGDCINRR
jgi:hypothetical protein